MVEINGRRIRLVMYKNHIDNLNDFNNFILTVENDSDIAIYRALLEGIRGENYSEIKNLKPSSIEVEEDRYFATLCDEEDGVKSCRRVEISEQLYEDLICAHHQTFYLDSSWHSEDMELYEFEESPYIFKPLEKDREVPSGEKIDDEVLKEREHILKHFIAGKNQGAITYADSGTVLNVRFRLNWKMER